MLTPKVVSNSKDYKPEKRDKKMDNENPLAELGLTNWESKTYLALLELGSTTTGHLIKKCEVPQSKIYGVLESLNKKGLTNHIIKGKIKYFQAVDPDKIIGLFKEKEKNIISLLNNLKQKQSSNKQSVELYEGFKSIRNMFTGIIENAKKGENWYGFGPGAYSKEVNDFYEWWGPKRESTGLKNNLLISKQNQKIFEENLTETDLKKVKKFTKYSNIFFPGDVFIYKDNVVILDWVEPPTAIHIISKNLAQQYMDFFQGLWESASIPK